MAALFVAVLALVISLAFNALQYRWRQQDRQDHASERGERRQKEEAPPHFYNSNGNLEPIRISGSQHSMQGPYVDRWGDVTVVNPTNAPMKIALVKLVLAGEQCDLHACFFRPRSDTRQSFQRISLRGNDKEDYEIHFMFPDTKDPIPPARDGELWLSSDNRPEPFVVRVSCP